MAGPTERSRLLGNLVGFRSFPSCFGRWSLFYFFCFLSGQYINVDFTKFFKKFVSVAGLILFGIQFLFYLGHVGTAVAVEACRIGNINTSNSTFTENCTTSCPANGTVINSTTSCTNDCIASCMINGLTNYTTNCTINCTLPQEHWKFSTAITIGSIASFLSYSLMTCWILIPVNVILCSEHHKNKGKALKSVFYLRLMVY